MNMNRNPIQCAWWINTRWMGQFIILFFGYYDGLNCLILVNGLILLTSQIYKKILVTRKILLLEILTSSFQHKRRALFFNWPFLLFSILRFIQICTSQKEFPFFFFKSKRVIYVLVVLNYNSFLFIIIIWLS